MIHLLFWALLGTANVDPIEGKWLGEIGFKQDRVQLGLDFRRTKDGELKAFLYQPVINFYGLELTGTVKADGVGKYTLPESGYSFKVQNGTLGGTWTGLKIPFSLRRATKLPTEKPIPHLPARGAPAWETRLGTQIWAPVAVRHGIAYVGNTGGVFQALNTEDGSIKWTFSAGRPILGEATIASGAVFFTCDDGYLYRLDAESGKEVWRYDLGDGRIPRVMPHPAVYDYDFKASRPLVFDGRVYVGSGANSFHAVDASTGKGIWRVETGGPVRTNAVEVGGSILFGSFDGFLYCFNALTGAVKWKRNTQAAIDTSPCVVGDTVILGNHGGLYGAYQASTGVPVWRLILWGSAVESTATLFESDCYMGSSDLRRVSRFDPIDGTVRWRTDVYGWAWGTPLVTRDFVYAGVAGANPYQVRHFGSLVKLDRGNGRIIWRWPLPQAADALYSGFAAGATLDGDTIVIASINGTVYGFREQ